MKKIYSILFLTACCMAFIACGDDNNVGSAYQHTSTVKVVKSDLIFSAAAGTGTVEFNAPTAATATVNATWATATVDGNKVSVTVNKNPDLEGRSALLTIKSGTDSTEVAIQQRGMVFKYGSDKKQFIYNDQASTITIPIHNEGSDLKITGLSWAEASISDAEISVKLAINDTGHVRMGYIYYTAGPYADSLLVIQGERKDIVNQTYALAGYDMTKVKATTKTLDEVFSTELATIAEDNGELVLYFPNRNWILPLNFDDSTLSFNVKAGVHMGMLYNAFHIFSAVVDWGYYKAFANNDLTYMLAHSAVNLSISGMFLYDEDQQVMVAPFIDNQTNDAMIKELTRNNSATFDANALGFFAFKSDQGAQAGKNNYQGAVNLYYQPFLIQLKEESGAKEVDIQTYDKLAPQLSPAKKQQILQRVKQQKIGIALLR